MAVKETSGTGEIAIVEVGEEGVKEEGKRVLEGTGKVQVVDFR